MGLKSPVELLRAILLQQRETEVLSHCEGRKEKMGGAEERKKTENGDGQPPPPPHLQVLRTAEKQTPDSLGGSDSPEGRFPERKPMMCLDSEASCQVSSFSAHFKVSSVQRNFQGGSCYFRAEKSDFPLFVPPSSPPGS